MLDHRPATDHKAETSAPPLVAALQPEDDRTIVAQVERCRQAFLDLGSDTGRAGLQVVDLSRLRQRLGPRWPALKDRVLEVIQGTITRELGANDLCVPGGDGRLFLLRVGPDRGELARHSELLAAEATARLCGTIPAGAAIRVHTHPFDADRNLATIASTAALRALFEGCTAPPANAGSASLERQLKARFRPLLNPRKRLVSAYQLAGFEQGSSNLLAPFQLARSSDTDDAAAAELDRWSLKQASLALTPPSPRAAVGLVVQLHYTTLAAMRWREEYIRLCRQLPPNSGRRLIFEVLELPAWLPQSRVRELMAYLRPFCGAIVVRLRTTSMHVEHLVGTGIRGLSLAGASPATDPNTPPASIKGLGELASIHAMRSLVVELELAERSPHGNRREDRSYQRRCSHSPAATSATAAPALDAPLSGTSRSSAWPE